MAAIAAFAVVVAGVMASVHAARRADDWVVHTLHVKVALGAYLTDLVDAETGERGYLITGDPSYLEPYRAARVGAKEHVVRELMQDNPRQLAGLDEAGALATARLEELRRVIELYDRDRSAALARVGRDRGKDLMDAFRRSILRLDQEEDRLFQERHAALRRAFTRTLVVLVGASVILGLALLHLVQTRRDLDRLRADAAVAIERARTFEFNDRFLAVLGHDLKNPLTAVRISVERMEKKLGAEAQPHVERIHRSLERMDHMIDQLLDLTRIRLGAGIRLAKRTIDVADVVRDVVDELRIARPRRNVEVVVSGDTVGSFDPDRLGQIVSNLVGNALTHGARELPVRVELEGHPTELVLRVENAGTIAENDRRVLFDPFRRGLHEPSKTTRSAGLGLGLSIVRHLVDQHGGRISVDGDTTTAFTVVLPH